MNEAKILCDDCEKEYKIKIENASEVFGIKCKFCNGDNTWITDIQLESNGNEIVLGNGGCGAPG